MMWFPILERSFRFFGGDFCYCKLSMLRGLLPSSAAKKVHHSKNNAYNFVSGS